MDFWNEAPGLRYNSAYPLVIFARKGYRIQIP